MIPGGKGEKGVGNEDTQHDESKHMKRRWWVNGRRGRSHGRETMGLNATGSVVDKVFVNMREIVYLLSLQTTCIMEL